MNSRRSAAKSIRRLTILVVGLFAIAFVGIRFAPQLFVVHANGESGTRLLRMPTVSATQIAFAYAQNIWAVPKAGGMARRVTSFQGQTSNPHFSPDGKWIAFSGEWQVTASDGESRRFGVGSVLLVEDTTGKGHSSSVVSETYSLAAMVQL